MHSVFFGRFKEEKMREGEKAKEGMFDLRALI